jgi:cell division protein FtsI/penicillin-binding protein 2
MKLIVKLALLISASASFANDNTVIPRNVPPKSSDGGIYFQTPRGPRLTTINPELQSYLTEFVANRNAPIASAVVVEVKTGRILAMVQGRDPQDWGSQTHTSLFHGFPAASIFKTIVAAAAVELTDLDTDAITSLYGGCAHVAERGDWLREQEIGRYNKMTMSRAFGKSCNGYFAKVGVSNVGLGPIINFAERFGWGKKMPFDFGYEAPALKAPSPETSSATTVGRFAAGFGNVGLSPMHAAWMMLALANDGVSHSMHLFEDTVSTGQPGPRVVESHTAAELRRIMFSTVHGGTATYAFNGRKFRNLRPVVGGKTGTLTGAAPKGLTTWFTGMMPLEKPEVVVASVVVLNEDRWFIKGPNLAAEAFWAYEDLKSTQEISSTETSSIERKKKTETN